MTRSASGGPNDGICASREGVLNTAETWRPEAPETNEDGPMDEQMHAGKNELEGERPDEVIEDLEPDERQAETVTGGGLNIEGVAGESQKDTH
jgi:hypothetical protein